MMKLPYEMVQNMPYKNLCSFLIFHIMLLHSFNNEFHDLYQYRPEHSLGKNKVALNEKFEAFLISIKLKVEQKL